MWVLAPNSCTNQSGNRITTNWKSEIQWISGDVSRLSLEYKNWCNMRSIYCINVWIILLCKWMIVYLRPVMNTYFAITQVFSVFSLLCYILALLTFNANKCISMYANCSNVKITWPDNKHFFFVPWSSIRNGKLKLREILVYTYFLKEWFGGLKAFFYIFLPWSWLSFIGIFLCILKWNVITKKGFPDYFWCLTVFIDMNLDKKNAKESIKEFY